MGYIVCSTHLQARGNFHQGSALFFERSRGKQCVANAIMALALNHLKKASMWTSSDLDEILYAGDQHYLDIIQYLTPAHQHLLVSEVSTHISICSTKFSIVQSEPMSGILLNDHTEPPMFSLDCALQRAFEKPFNSCIVILGKYAIAGLLDEDDHNYYVFDSHSRNEKGMSSPNGRSVLVRMGPQVSDISKYMLELSHSLGLHLVRYGHFEVVPMLLTPQPTSPVATQTHLTRALTQLSVSTSSSSTIATSSAPSLTKSSVSTSSSTSLTQVSVSTSSSSTTATSSVPLLAQVSVSTSSSSTIATSSVSLLNQPSVSASSSSTSATEAEPAYTRFLSQ
jgi:hypothetical protein